MQILLDRWRTWWRARYRRCHQPVLVVVEGSHDIEFLKRISRILHATDPRLPNLEQAASNGKILWIPAGGGNLGAWTLRLAALRLPEVHLYDREMSPETRLRSELVAAINGRSHCHAWLTRKRGLENYLHASAIREAAGITLTFGDDDSVASHAARAVYESKPHEAAWDMLSARVRKRLRDRQALAQHTSRRTHDRLPA